MRDALKAARDALAKMVAVYQAMGNPRGPTEIIAEAAIAQADAALAVAVDERAASDDEWIDLASRHANADWNSDQPDGYLNAVKALVSDATRSRLSAPADVARAATAKDQP